MSVKGGAGVGGSKLISGDPTQGTVPMFAAPTGAPTGSLNDKDIGWWNDLTNGKIPKEPDFVGPTQPTLLPNPGSPPKFVPPSENPNYQDSP